MRATIFAWLPWTDARGAVSPLRAAVFAALLWPAAWMAWWWRSGVWLVPQGDLTYWSGVWAMVVLLASLAVTPLAVILGRPRLAQVRRMVGVAALVYTLAHLGFFAWLRFWDIGAVLAETFTRLSLVLAFLSLVGLAALGATSFDGAMRRMGRAGWKRLHRGTYVLTALAVAHFILSPGSYGGLPFLALGAYLWLMGWRWLDRRGRGTDPAALLALTAGSALSAMLSEAAIPAILLDTDPVATLRWNFSLSLGLAPVWKILLVGGALSAVAGLRQLPPGRAAKGS
ncbi:hypothetical protein HKCCE2091_02965 [Rhodobacterales bacterium HKCCE2091]|nr:hypothetical protein [Rhodobacterales bacterium HKCCE2091]